MNPHFGEYGGERGFPRRSYAKLEQVEPVAPGKDDPIFIAFEAIDAHWPELRNGGWFAQTGYWRPNRMTYWYWARGLRGIRHPPSIDFLDRVPLFRIEFTLHPGHPWRDLIVLNEDVWFDIELEAAGEIEAEVYPGLFADPVKAALTGPPTISPMTSTLARIFDESLWPDASEPELLSELSRPNGVETLVAPDVGQGSSVSLMGAHGTQYYFDVGCGVYANRKTRPSLLQFCGCADPVVLLSHWDKDHWAAATLDHSLLKRNWIVPRQLGLPAGHIAFANTILKSGGNILVVPRQFKPLKWSSGSQDFELVSCTGKSRNGSGLALHVTDQVSGQSWMLTGDAGYGEIPAPHPTNVAALTVPHHGADMTTLGSAPPPSSQPYRRAAYSFGPGNKNGKTTVQHPVVASVNDHHGKGWLAGTWHLATSPGGSVPAADTLAAATHPTTHDGGMAIGFTSAPALPLPHEAHCPKPMPITQT